MRLEPTPENPQENRPKPCCACPETRNARDECMFKSKGNDSNEDCKDLIEAHRRCMATFGYKV